MLWFHTLCTSFISVITLVTALVPETLLTAYAPVYALHSQERFYPLHPEDLLRASSLQRDNHIIIPYGKLTGSTAIADPDALQAFHLHLDNDTLLALRGIPISLPGNVSARLVSGHRSDYYAYLEDLHVLPGALTDHSLQPPNSTWYHQGAPGCIYDWIPGRNCSQWSQQVLQNTATHTYRPLQQYGQIMNSTVSGVEYVDLIYTIMLGYNGDIAFLPGLGAHVFDLETVAVRFWAQNLSAPLRIYMSQHAGFSWYDWNTETLEFWKGHVKIYLGRESHEPYPTAGRHTRLYGLADDLTDDLGVLYTPPVIYMPRLDCHITLPWRCQVNREDPDSVMVVVHENASKAWWWFVGGFAEDRKVAYVSNSMPSSREFWLEEGFEVRSDGSKAAALHPSPGVPVLSNVATYLGPAEPLTCKSTNALYDFYDFKSTSFHNRLYSLYNHSSGFFNWSGQSGLYVQQGLTQGLIPWALWQLVPRWISQVGHRTFTEWGCQIDLNISNWDIGNLSAILNTTSQAYNQTSVHFTVTSTSPWFTTWHMTALSGGTSYTSQWNLSTSLTLEVLVHLKLPVTHTTTSEWFMPDASFWQFGSLLNITESQNLISGQVSPCKVQFPHIAVAYVAETTPSVCVNFLWQGFREILLWATSAIFSSICEKEGTALLHQVLNGSYDV